MNTMIKIKNEKIMYLKNVGVLSTGEAVSNYNKLPIEKLLKEGWKFDKTIEPDYDPEYECLDFDRYEIKDDTIQIIYKKNKLII